MAFSRAHDRALLDALAAIAPIAFEGEVWRITRAGRDPLIGSLAQGRWSPGGEFEVLYTSLARECALAEIGHRLSLEPIWPSQIVHEIHRLRARTFHTLKIADAAALVPLGIDAGKYGSYDYRGTQAIATAAHFLEFDGLMVPSARAASSNLVLFLERLPADSLAFIKTETVNWAKWRRRRRLGQQLFPHRLIARSALHN